MKNDFWMAAKAYLPAALTFAVAFMLLGLQELVAKHEMLWGIAQTLSLGSVSAFLLAIIFVTYASVRLVRAEFVEGLLCDCGGLLGREVDGRYGPYRRCLRCNRAQPHRKYKMLE